MNKKIFKNIEWSVLIYSLILFCCGLVALYSASKNSDFEEFNKQIKWFIISIPFLISVASIDYLKIIKYSFLYYILICVLLILVLKTAPVNGASSWFDLGSIKIQPSEIGKIFIITAVSQFIVRMQYKGKNELNKLHKLFLVLLVMMLPILLILKQPDYGTAAAYLIAYIFILFVAGIKKRYIISALIITPILMYLMYIYILPHYAPHSIQRINVFLNPNIDPRGAGYNIIQSKLAVGSGYVFGMGLLKGTQTQLGYLYPITTDFIYALIAEELGFIVSGTIIVVYVLLITKAIKISKTAKDNAGAYIAAGISGVFFFHMIQNIGMTMGLLPITGVPLPFVSYGGSALVTNFIAIGLLLNISARRQKAIFVDMERRKQ
ncbi:MAG: rod shape-determining protein RodA [Clostridium sp.]